MHRVVTKVNGIWSFFDLFSWAITGNGIVCKKDKLYLYYRLHMDSFLVGLVLKGNSCSSSIAAYHTLFYPDLE